MCQNTALCGNGLNSSTPKEFADDNFKVDEKMAENYPNE